MEFRLLGPVEAGPIGDPVRLGGGKPRALLAALLLEHGRLVPTDRLIDAVWGDAPPGTARALLHTYVAALRRVGVQQIRTRPAGYLIETDQIDLVRFERLVATARQADPGRRADLLTQALRLWRGPALAGLTSEPLRAQAARLDELRLTVLEERITADLALDRHDALIGELVELVGTHPSREGLRRALMVALHRAGRQADALTVYQDGRRAIIEALGIEPGPALRAAHAAILRGADPDRPAARDAGPVPRQLPAVPADFTGRTAQIAELTARLAPADRPGTPVAVIAGAGGTGKSTLAARVGHELADRYPDGQLFAALHGMTDTPTTPDAVLAEFLGALGETRYPGTLAGRADRYRTLLAGRRVLVVLDDAADEAQVRPLLPGGPDCAVLITSRSRLGGLAGARLTELSVLAPTEATTLLSRIVGEQRVRAAPRAAADLVALCGGLPLAVRIVGARLATRQQWSLARLAERLADERGRLDELRVGDLWVRASIALSWTALDERARTALRRLGYLGLGEFPDWVVGAVLATGADAPADAEQVLERLVDAQFLDWSAAGRCRLHDLLRLFACERALSEEDSSELTAAVRRVLAGWISKVDAICARHPAGTIVMRVAKPDGPAQPAELGGGEDWLADPRGWLADNQHALVASVERAAALDLADLAAGLASALSGSLFATDNRFSAWNRTHDAALAAVRRNGNRAAEAALLSELGQLRYEQDRYAEALAYFQQALAVFQDLADPRGGAATLVALGIACREHGQLAEAQGFLDKALATLTELADRPALASAQRAAGMTRLEQGALAEAETLLFAALDTYRATGGRRGTAMALRAISLLHRARGEYEPAARLADEALTLFRAVGDELLIGYALQARAKAELRLGRFTPAGTALIEARERSHRFGDRWGSANVTRTMGELALAQGHWARAYRRLTAAERGWAALGLPLPRARTLRGLAAVLVARGDPDRAARLREEAMAVFVRCGARERFE